MTTFYTTEKTSYGGHFTVRGAVTYTVAETPTTAVLQVTFTPQCKMNDSTYSGLKLRQESATLLVYKYGNPRTAGDYSTDISKQDETDYEIATLSTVGTWVSGVSSSGSVTYNKSTGAVSHAAYFHASFDVHNGQQTVTTIDPIDSLYTDLISIPPVYYTLSYDGNGGTGSTPSSSKYYGESVDIRSNGFSRANYSFRHWNTAVDNTGTTYSPGASYSANANLTMYAIWDALVKYDANGGSGAPATQAKHLGTTLTLSSTTPTRDGYSFGSWNTSSSGTGTSYQPGGSYTSDSPVTLYAIWKKKPVLTNLSAVRCDSSGNPSEDKGYVKVSASYQSDYAVSATSASVGESTASGTTYSSGTGTIEIIVGNGDLLPLSQYSVSISATSEAGTTASSFALPPSTVYTMPTVTLTNIRRCRSGRQTQQDALGKYIAVRLATTVYSEESTTSATLIRKFTGKSETTVTLTNPNYSNTLVSAVYTYETLEPGKSYQNAYTATVVDKFGYRATATIDLGDDGYTYPQVASVTAYRSDTSGNPEDEGETATVSIAWSICETLSQKAPTSFSITARDMDDNLIASKSLSLSNTTSGPTTYTFVAADRQDGGSGDDMFDTDEKYVIRVEVEDKFTSDYKADVLSTAYFTMDVLAGGHGVAFGKPAAREALDVGMPAYFDNALTIAEKLSLPVYEYATTPSTSDLNSVPCIAVVDTGEIYLGYEVSDTVSLMRLSGSVTGVKGNAESTYRTGDVNITPANIGAVDKTGDSMSGVLAIGQNNYLTTQRTDYSDANAPSSSMWMDSVIGYDANASYSRFNLRQVAHSDGYQGVQLEAHRRVSGADKYNGLRMEIDGSGNMRVDINQPSAWLSGMGAAAANHTHNYWPKYSTWVDLSSLNTNTWYPVTGTELGKDGMKVLLVSVQLNSGTTPPWASHGSGFSCELGVVDQAGGWGTTYAYGFRFVDNYRWTQAVSGVADQSPVSYDQMGTMSVPVFYMRGGGKYWVATSYECTWTVRTSSYTAGADTVSPQSGRPYPKGELLLNDNRKRPVGWTSLAYTTGQSGVGFSLSDYAEVLVVARRRNSYLGSAVMPVGWLDGTGQELYLGGGRSASGSGGRNAQCTLYSTAIYPLNIVIDGTTYTDGGNEWWVLAR